MNDLHRRKVERAAYGAVEEETVEAKANKKPTTYSSPAEKISRHYRPNTTTSLVYLICSLPSLLSIAIIVYGIHLNHTILYSHDECDMTWSHRVFVSIPLPDNSLTKSPELYQLYKFTDHRDLRNERLLESDGNSSLAWCFAAPNDAKTTTAILYVPGHGGSYQQARSLGAHGIQMTEKQLSNKRTQNIQQSLISRKWTGNAKRLEDFVYDVFAVDFHEEPTGLHGAFVQKQAEFLVQTIHHLIQTCRFNQILLVAHSMGGYAAEMARILDPSIQPFIRNQITLGTPHAHPVLSWEPSLYEVHQRIQQEAIQSNDLAIISISGGLRDEMIPPRACNDSPHSASLSVLATDIMTRVKHADAMKQPPTLGMDHKAIVWCHNLLDNVRITLHEFVVSDHLPATGRVKRIQERLDLLSIKFDESVKQQEDKLWAMFGWKAFAMETSLNYNIAWLVSLYCYIALCHCIIFIQTIRSTLLVQVVTGVLIPLMAALQCWMESPSNRLSYGSACVLSFTASSIFRTSFYIIDRVLAGRWSRVTRNKMLRVSALVVPSTACLVAAILFLACTFSILPFPVFQPKVCLSLSLLVLTGVFTIIQIGMVSKRKPPLPSSRSALQAALNLSKSPDYYVQSMNHRRVVIATWLFIVSPFLLLGDVAVILRHGEVHSRVFLLLISPIICWNLTCLLLDSLPRSFGKGRVSMLAHCLRMFTVIQSGTALFRLSSVNGYASGTVDSIVAILRLEMLETLIVWFLARVSPS